MSLGKGDGTFGAPVEQPNGVTDFSVNVEEFQALFAGDFNGDGKADLIATGSPANGQYYLYLLNGNGDGTFSIPKQLSNVPTISYMHANQPIADVNGDGRSDIFWVNYASTGTYLTVSLSNGDGTFREVNTLLSGAEREDAFLADANGDGKLDALYSKTGFIYVVPGNGDGTFNTTTEQYLALPSVPNKTYTEYPVITPGDFDGDGKVDLAVLSSAYTTSAMGGFTDSAVVVVFYGNGDGTFTAGTPQLYSTQYGDAFGVDLDGDHRSELVVRTTADVNQENRTVAPALSVLHFAANRTSSPTVDSYTAGSGLSSLSVADVNRDGKPDLVLANGDYTDLADSVTVLLNLGTQVGVTGSVTASPEPSQTQRSFTVTAMLTPPVAGVLGGSVSFTVDGVSVGQSAIANNAATVTVTTPLAIGTHTLSASWTGDVNYPGLTFTGSHTVVGLTTTTVLSSSANPSVAGSALTLTAQVNATGAAPPSGTVTFLDGSTVIGTAYSPRTTSSGSGSSYGVYSVLAPTLAVGTHTLTASFAGDGVNAASSGSLTQVVQGIAVNMTLVAQPVSVSAGQQTTLTATVVNAAGMSGPGPGGSVVFTDGSVTLGTAALNASGVAVLAGTLNSSGLRTIVASYAGDALHASGSASAAVQVQKVGTSLVLTSAGNPSPALVPVVFGVKLSLAQTTSLSLAQMVTLSEGARVLGSVALGTDGSGSVTVNGLSVGSHSVTASFAGTDGLLAATSNAVVQVVNLQPTGVVVTASPNPAYQSQAVALSAVVSTSVAGVAPPTGAVRFFDGVTALGDASVAANAAKLTVSSPTVGSHTITAQYLGDGNYAAAVSGAVTETVLPSDLLLSASPSSLTVETQHHLMFTLTGTSVGVFADTVLFSTTRLPAHATVQFTPVSGTVAAGGMVTTSVYLDTSDVIGYASVQRPAVRDRGMMAALAGIGMLPVGVLLAARRRRYGGVLLLAVMALLSVGLSGCSGKYPASVAPGSYMLHLVATGENTGLVKTLDVPLTVTP